MKKINQFITEKFKINSKTAKKNIEYNYHPKTNEELIQTVYRLIQKRGKDADLNDIDTSGITDMESVFADNDVNRSFNGDISDWDVSNVENMNSMFLGSKFTGKNGDISNWNVSKVENMFQMFAYSKFDNDLSDWNVSNVKYMFSMFYKSPLEKNPPKWYHE